MPSPAHPATTIGVLYQGVDGVLPRYSLLGLFKLPRYPTGIAILGLALGSTLPEHDVAGHPPQWNEVGQRSPPATPYLNHGPQVGGAVAPTSGAGEIATLTRQSATTSCAVCGWWVGHICHVWRNPSPKRVCQHHMESYETACRASLDQKSPPKRRIICHLYMFHVGEQCMLKCTGKLRSCIEHGT